MIADSPAGAIDAGAKIILGIAVEDVTYREKPTRIVGIVVQWDPVPLTGLQVDKLGVKVRAVIDYTGHDAEVTAMDARKIPELNLTVPRRGRCGHLKPKIL